MLLVCAWLISLRVRNYERGTPDDRRTTTAQRPPAPAPTSAPGVWMRTLLRDPAAGVMHSMIYFGFLWLFVATVILEIDHQLPDNLKFLHGEVYQAYAASPTSPAWSSSSGSLWAIARRYVQRPYRIRIKTKPEDAVILGTFLLIAVTGLHGRGLPHRADRPPVATRSGRSSGTRSRASVDGWAAGDAASTCTARCGSRTSPRSSPSS